MPTVGKLETPTNEADITNNWWPDISLSDARQIIRADGNLPGPRLRSILTTALLDTNSDLRSYQQRQKEKGHNNASELPDSDTIKHYYLHAVYSRTEAQLIERYAGYDATENAQDTAERLAGSIDRLKASALDAIRTITGETRITVELI